jgi:hypothetical protein
LIEGIEGDIAAVGQRVDGHSGRISKLEQEQVSASDVDNKVNAAVIPLATKEFTDTLDKRIDVLENEVRATGVPCRP